MARKISKAAPPPPAGPPADVPPLRLEYRDASELAGNPRNWRKHPAAQVAALSDLISEVGWAGAVLYNERTGRLLDGHARRNLPIAGQIPVLIGSWTEAQEVKILATLDPIAGMAEVDLSALADLLQHVSTDSESLSAILDDLASESRLMAPVVPQEAREDGPPGEGTKYARLGDAAKVVHLAVYVEDVAMIERAILETGNRNRGKALAMICEHFLDDDPTAPAL